MNKLIFSILLVLLVGSSTVLAGFFDGSLIKMNGVVTETKQKVTSTVVLVTNNENTTKTVLVPSTELYNEKSCWYAELNLTNLFSYGWQDCQRTRPVMIEQVITTITKQERVIVNEDKETKLLTTHEWINEDGRIIGVSKTTCDGNLPDKKAIHVKKGCTYLLYDETKETLEPFEVTQ